MNVETDFTAISYARHEANRSHNAHTWLAEDTVDAWRHRRMYATIDPLLEEYPGARWLTLGDGRYATDARYLRGRNAQVVATDISDDLLREAHRQGLIDAYSKENAEALSFADGSFDFALCKEAYHHFPRPMKALYEMLRVARRGVLLIEPLDRCALPSNFLSFTNGLKSLASALLGRGTSPHEYEPVGNYVYSLSEREIEKVALGLNLPAVAFRGLNDCYCPGVEQERAVDASPLFRKVRRKIRLLDICSKLGLYPTPLLIALILKESVSPSLRQRLRAAGFRVNDLPRNPYVQTSQAA
ncbi:MAG: class I SAM-dependent methyltransferase [Planctomycetia bacterium]|nr:class I SAM-dependent methyltransferase [Planctomycetia bacterium]